MTTTTPVRRPGDHLADARDFAAAWGYFRIGARLGVLREVLRGYRMAATIRRTAGAPEAAADFDAAADYLADLLPAEAAA